MTDPGNPSLPISRRGLLRLASTKYGRSVEGAALRVWGPLRPGGLLALAGVHGEEAATVAVVSRALRSIEPDRVTASVVLCVNPDGLVYGTRGNARGVDLNRNFPTRKWRHGVIRHRWGSEAQREVELSTGEHAASEAEVASLLALVSSLRPAVILDVHSPLAQVIDSSATALGRELAERLALRLVTSNPGPEGSAGRYFAETCQAYVNMELPHDSLISAKEEIVPCLASLLSRPVGSLVR